MQGTGTLQPVRSTLADIGRDPCDRLAEAAAAFQDVWARDYATWPRPLQFQADMIRAGIAKYRRSGRPSGSGSDAALLLLGQLRRFCDEAERAAAEPPW